MANEFTLAAHAVLPKSLPVCVAILDGYGENEFLDEYNAVHAAQTPVFDKLRASSSRFRTVAAHGPAVGLPSSDDMGNSVIGPPAAWRAASAWCIFGTYLGLSLLVAPWMHPPLRECPMQGSACEYAVA